MPSSKTPLWQNTNEKKLGKALLKNMIFPFFSACLPKWSLEDTANIEFGVMSLNPKFAARLCLSIGKAHPAIAPLPSGHLDNLLLCSSRRVTSSRRPHAWLKEIQLLKKVLIIRSEYYCLCRQIGTYQPAYLIRKWLHLIGCARWRWVYPGAMISISLSARSTNTWNEAKLALNK